MGSFFRRLFGAFESTQHHDHEAGRFESTWAMTVHTTEDSLDGGFIAWVDEMPGCVADGDTEEDAIAALGQVIQLGMFVRLVDAPTEIEFDDHDQRSTKRILQFG